MQAMTAWLARAPLAWVLVAVSVAALGSTIWSLAPRRPLAEHEGFADAMTALGTEEPTTFVVITPPEETAALDLVPKHLHASDALPSASARTRWSSIIAVGPRGTELTSLGKESERRSFGDIDLVRYGNPSGERVIFDLERDLARVMVTLQPRVGADSTSIACDVPSDGGFACPGRPSWNHVGPAHLTVNGVSWPCTWAHPVSDHDLTLALGELELGDAIVLEAALDDPVARSGAAIEMELRIGNETRHYVRTPAVGVLTARVPTRRGERAPVALTIRTAHDGQRHFGVRLSITAAQP